MFSFDPTAGHLVITDNVLKALLTDRAKRQVIIEQPAQQLPPVTVDAVLQSGVIQASSVGPVQETDQRLKPLAAIRKPGHHSQLAQRAGGVVVISDRTITTTAPERQDFTTPRVKFNNTGVEIGGHVGHLRGRRRT
jgi:hypothetical protein